MSTKRGGAVVGHGEGSPQPRKRTRRSGGGGGGGGEGSSPAGRGATPTPAPAAAAAAAAAPAGCPLLVAPLPSIAAFLAAPDLAALLATCSGLRSRGAAAWAAAAAAGRLDAGSGARAAVIAAHLLSVRRCFLCQRGGASVFGGWDIAVCAGCFPLVFLDTARTQERLGVSLVSLPVLQVRVRAGGATGVLRARRALGAAPLCAEFLLYLCACVRMCVCVCVCSRVWGVGCGGARRARVSCCICLRPGGGFVC